MAVTTTGARGPRSVALPKSDWTAVAERMKTASPTLASPLAVLGSVTSSPARGCTGRVRRRTSSRRTAATSEDVLSTNGA